MAGPTRASKTGDLTVPLVANTPDVARPTFQRLPIENRAESEREGRPIFNEKEMVTIRIPGDPQLTWDGEVTDEHRNRWPDQYAAFKRGEQRAASGTPIEQWPSPFMTTSRVAELKAIGILSVEELANLQDGLLGKLGIGGREQRDAARVYLEAAKDGAATNAMAIEIARLKEMVEKLQHVSVPVEAPQTLANPLEAQQERNIDDCSNDELKQFIKERTGEGVRGQPSRETLVSRVHEIVKDQG